MTNITTTYNNKEYTRITKTEARKLFDNGIEILFHNSNCRLDSMAVAPTHVVKGFYFEDFDTAVNVFEFYNACYGNKYSKPWFYKEV